MSFAKLLGVVGRVPGVSSVLRFAARRYREGSVVAIRCGHGRGLLWKRSHRYVNGFWVGQYELGMQDALARLLKPDGVFFDVGANAGFFSLLAAARFAPRGRCVAVEPLPVNCETMREQAKLNGLQNWTILQQAVADRPGRLAFVHSAGAVDMGHLGEVTQGASESSFEVDVTTIDALSERFGPPSLIKLDVEGAEGRATAGAEETLRRHRPIWVMELHSAELAEEVGTRMRAFGYTFTEVDGRPVGGGALPHHVIALPSK